MKSEFTLQETIAIFVATFVFGLVMVIAPRERGFFVNFGLSTSLSICTGCALLTAPEDGNIFGEEHDNSIKNLPGSKLSKEKARQRAINFGFDDEYDEWYDNKYDPWILEYEEKYGPLEGKKEKSTNTFC